MEQVIGAAVKSGDIKIVGETYTDNWDPAKAANEHGADPHAEPEQGRCGSL